MPVITLKYKDKVLDKYQIGIGQNVTIGRSESNDIVIDNLAVSANHARIESVSASFIIKDLGSTNGTFVNEQLVSAHGLKNNDVILIGKHTLIFDRSDLDQLRSQADRANTDEKTRYLDTAEYRELIRRATRDKPQKRYYSDGVVSRDMSGGFLMRIWRRLFG
ncbi:MAG: FHA domain-containing protein [Desulfofustis sp.]|jgi:pSer/pThr/pTyr-binding forkhead associated (FHA) protein|nr:FHA domain-containing protein [Desulfofustis sp.]